MPDDPRVHPRASSRDHSSMGEHLLCTQEVQGSNPCDSIGNIAQLAEQRPVKPRVVGSSPTVPVYAKVRSAASSSS